MAQVIAAPERLRSLGDIRNGIIGMAGETTGNTKINSRIDLLVNQRYREVLNQKFDFTFAEASILLSPAYETGTASVSNGSTTVTGTSTSWTAAGHQGQKIKFDDSDEIYRVSVVNSTTSITLDKAYQGDAVTDGTYSIIIDSYVLPSDFDELVKVWSDTSQKDLEIRPLGELIHFQNRSPLASSAAPTLASLDYEGNDGNPRLRIWPLADDNTLIHLLYQRRIAPMVKDDTYLKDNQSLNGSTVSSFDHTASWDKLTYVTAVGSGTTALGNLTITGTGWLGNTVTETLALDGTTEVKSANRYKTVTSIVVPTVASVTIDLGIDDPPLMPEKYVDILFWGGLADAYEFQGEIESRQNAEQKFMLRLAKLQQSLSMNRQPLSLSVRDKRRNKRLSPATYDLGSLFDRS